MLSLKLFSLFDSKQILFMKPSGVGVGWVRDSSKMLAMSWISYFLMPVSSISLGLTLMTPSR